MAEKGEPERPTFNGAYGHAVVMAPDKRGQGRKVPAGHEQYHGFWRVVYSPGGSETNLSAPEVLRAEDEETARELAKRAVEEGFSAVKHARYSRM